MFGNVHALQRYGARIAEYLQAVAVEADSTGLRQMREDLKIDRILSDMGPLIEGTLEGAERVSDIVQDLRRYSGGQQEESSRFELAMLVRKAVQWVVKASRTKPEVQYRLPETLEIDGRKGQVHQILVNLVQNAVDAMQDRDRPRLSLVCTESQDRVSIAVIDNGPGVSEDDLKHVFDPFFTTKAVGQGTGLGLYISYGLARDLGGDLAVHNHADGGAVFTLTLPLEQGR